MLDNKDGNLPFLLLCRMFMTTCCELELSQCVDVVLGSCPDLILLKRTKGIICEDRTVLGYNVPCVQVPHSRKHFANQKGKIFAAF